MSTPHQGGPPRGLSEHLKTLEHSSGARALPDFDLDGAIRGGRRRARRRTAASVIGTAAAVAAVVTGVTLSPLGDHGAERAPAQRPTPTASAPVPTPNTPAPTSPSSTSPSSTNPSSTSPSNASVVTGGALVERTDTGRVTGVTTTAGGTTITYDRYQCDDALDSSVERDPQNGNQFACELPPPPGGLINRSGTDTGVSDHATLAPDAVVLGSQDLADFLGKTTTADGGGWAGQLPDNRRVSVDELLRFLGQPRSTLFRFTINAQDRVSGVKEINNQL